MRALIVCVILAALITGCVDEEKCKALGYGYVGENAMGIAVRCAEIDRDRGIVDFYDDKGNHNETMSLEETFGVRRVAK